MKRVFVLAVLLVAVVLAVAGVVTYIVTRPPTLIDLNVVDGSTVETIQGNLTSYGSLSPLVLNFASTTYANETNGAASTLSLRLHTVTDFSDLCGCVEVGINATATGVFASDLHPAALQLEANQTGPNGSLDSWADRQFGTNVTFDPGQSFGFFNGTGVLYATVVGGAYRFSYSDFFYFHGRPWYNRVVGFRATVTGPFAPAVSVGILLKIINTNGGTWA